MTNIADISKIFSFFASSSTTSADDSSKTGSSGINVLGSFGFGGGTHSLFSFGSSSSSSSSSSSGGFDFSFTSFNSASSSITTALSDISKIASKANDTTALTLSQEVSNCQTSLDTQRAMMEIASEKANNIDIEIGSLDSYLSDKTPEYSELVAKCKEKATAYKKLGKDDKNWSKYTSEANTLAKRLTDLREKISAAENEKAELLEQKRQLAVEAQQHQAEADRIKNKAEQTSAKAKTTNITSEENKKEVKQEDVASRIVDNEIVDETMANGIINKLGDDADFIEAKDLTGVSYDTARDKASELVEAHKGYSENSDEAQKDSSTVANNQTAKTSFLDEYSSVKEVSSEKYEFLSVNEKYDYASMVSVADKLNNNEYVDTDTTNKASATAKLISGKEADGEAADDPTNPFMYNQDKFETAEIA